MPRLGQSSTSATQVSTGSHIRSSVQKEMPIRSVEAPNGFGQSGDGRRAWLCASGQDHAASGCHAHRLSLRVCRLDEDRARADKTAASAPEKTALAYETVDRDLVVPVVGRLRPDPGREQGKVGFDADAARHVRRASRLGEQFRARIIT